MSFDVNINPALSRAEKYPLVVEQAAALVEGESDLIANLANLAALLKESLGFHWVGFYRLIGNELVLGPFQGPPACTRIVVPKGVCGTCVKRKEAIIVPDVEAFEGHIACSSLTRSELVIPLLVNGEVKLILDVDSMYMNDFNLEDLRHLDNVLKSCHAFF